MKKYYANNESISQSVIENSIEITAEQYGLAMSAKLRGQVVEVVNGELVIKAPYVKVMAYLKSHSKKQKEFADKTLVTDDYTLAKPPHPHVTWNENLGDWQLDAQTKYEAELQQVASIREGLYVQIVDRLNNEAKMIRRLEGDEAKAAEYEAQADAAYLKIRADNPWPTPPEV